MRIKIPTWISSRYNYKPPKSKFSNILFICFDLVQLDHGRPDNEGQEFTSRKEGIPMATTSPYLLSEGFATMVARQSSKIATMYESIANPLHPRSCSMSNMSIYRSLQHDGCRYVYYIFMDRMDPVGMCFSAKNNFREIRSHRPCVESGRKLFHYTYANFFLFFFLTLLCPLSVVTIVTLGLRSKIRVVLAKF